MLLDCSEVVFMFKTTFTIAQGESSHNLMELGECDSKSILRDHTITTLQTNIGEMLSFY